MRHAADLLALCWSYVVIDVLSDLDVTANVGGEMAAESSARSKQRRRFPDDRPMIH